MLLLTAVLYIDWVIWTGYQGEAVLYNLPYANAIFDGTAPFTPQGDLRWEYPPLAYLLLLPPRIFTTDPTIYMALYTVEVLVFLIIGLRILMKMISRTGASPVLIVGTYLLSVLLLGHFIYDRFDIIVAVIALAAVYMFVTNRYFAASVLVVLGMFMKIYPALFLLVFFVFLFNRRQYRDIAVQAVFCLVLCAVLMAPFLIMAPDNAWNFVSYHGDRGLQVESTAASIIMLFGTFGFGGFHVISSFGSWNLGGSVADSLASVTFAAMVVAILVSLAFYFLRDRICPENEREMWLMLGCAAVLTSFVILNKVFSAQYVIWLITAYLPLAMYLRSGKSYCLCIAALVMVYLTMVMVKLYDDLVYNHPDGIVVLFIRNVLVLSMLAFMWKGLFKGASDDASGGSGTVSERELFRNAFGQRIHRY